ncbi:MAG: aldose 1-epimerase [Actinomycetota bacterium]|nr:aldose 1-epimerase [Actinomycetota bacterium]
MSASARVTRYHGEAAVTLAAGTLAAGTLEFTVLPDVGMLGVSLRHDGEELLALPHGVAGYRAGHSTGLPFLAPWANRLSRWSYKAAGVAVDLQGLPIHTDGDDHPMHGTMGAQPGWEILDLHGGSLRARFDFAAREDLLASFPFPHEIVVDLGVDGTTLTVATTIRATGDRDVPVSFGFHPYLRLPRAPRPSWRLRLPDRRHVDLDEAGLPTGASEEEAAGWLTLGDDSFDDLFALGDDRSLVLEGGGRSVSVDLDVGYPYAQVYAPAGRRFCCLEPMTAPTDALVSGAHPSAPAGGSLTARFSLTPRHTG